MRECPRRVAGHSCPAKAGLGCLRSGAMAIRMVFRALGLNETRGGRRAPRVRPGGSQTSRSVTEEENPVETENQSDRREEGRGGGCPVI